jgi:hypothetical protein
MSQLCVISGVVVDPNGAPVAGADIRIDRAIVNNSRSTTYETSTVSGSDGSFSFSVPQRSRVRFQSYGVADIDGWTVTVPNTVAKGLGNFRSNTASQIGSRSVQGVGSVPAAASPHVSARILGDVARQLILTLVKLPVTLVKNGTSSGGGGTNIFTFAEGLILPKGGSSNLTVANALDKSFLASVGSAAAGTDGSLTSTEANMLPQTAATTTSGAGTCKMKSTVSVPVPGTPLDGTSSPIAMYLNACLNADATGGEALTFSGTITINFEPLGDN